MCREGHDMNEYSFAADCLNKYSQLTPWVQALIGLSAGGVMLGIAYFVKEMVAVVMRPFQGDGIPKVAKPAWRDKYYRDEKAQ